MEQNDGTISRQSAALACKRMKGTHSFDKIAEFICEINDKYGLNPAKITKTVTDNGSNFIKAFKEYGINMDLSELSDSEDEDSDDEIIAETEEDSEINFHEDLVEEIRLPEHISCASHSLNLIATTDFGKSLDKSSRILNAHKTVIIYILNFKAFLINFSYFISITGI